MDRKAEKTQDHLKQAVLEKINSGRAHTNDALQEDQLLLIDPTKIKDVEHGLGPYNKDYFKEAIDRAVEDNPDVKVLALDMHDINYVGSCAFWVLIGAQRELIKRGTGKKDVHTTPEGIILVDLDKDIKDSLRLVQMNGYFGMVDTKK